MVARMVQFLHGVVEEDELHVPQWVVFDVGWGYRFSLLHVMHIMANVWCPLGRSIGGHWHMVAAIFSIVWSSPSGGSNQCLFRSC